METSEYVWNGCMWNATRVHLQGVVRVVGRGWEGRGRRRWGASG